MLKKLSLFFLAVVLSICCSAAGMAVASDIPGSATLIRPSGNIADNKPSFQWLPVSGATHYQLRVQANSTEVLKRSYTADAIGCIYGACNITSDVTLGAGLYTWDIQASNAVGSGPWSSAMGFTITTPGAVTLTYPVGTVGTVRPRYTWYAAENATHYYLSVDDSTGSKIRQWFTAQQAGCTRAGQTCAITPAVDLASGAANWQIQTWSARGDGSWSVRVNFTVNPVSRPPVAATLISPSGQVDLLQPTFTWKSVANASWYQIYVNDSNNRKLTSQWFNNAAVNCPAGEGNCTLKPDLSLGDGQYTWWIQTWNEIGYGPWSSPMQFSNAFPLGPPSVLEFISITQTDTGPAPDDDADPPELDLNRAYLMTIRVTDIYKRPVSGERIFFSATRGILSNTHAVTNVNGNASVTITSNTAGPSTVTASMDNDLRSQQQVLFIATIPASMILHAVPSVVGKNQEGETSEKSTIHAILRDANFNLVKNQTIEFNLTDVTGGQLTESSVITDRYGRASTSYISGEVPSTFDKVEIRGYVRNFPQVREIVELTVAGGALSIRLGTGNLIKRPDPDTPQSILYYLPYSALVTDSAGNPVANAELSLSLWPQAYYKGYYERVYFYGVTPRFLYWQQIIEDGPIPNEDLNRNGVLDPNEDVNGNRRLDPGNVATFVPRSDSATSSNPLRIQTDESGFAFFDVAYAQEFASWVDMELEARAFVYGTEASSVAEFRLPILGTDLTDEHVYPPGAISPFGRAPEEVGETTYITLQATPNQINANGYATTTIEARLMDDIGRPVVRGTPATFEIIPANTGTFPNGNSIYQAITTDDTGIIRVTLTAGLVNGRAAVTCTSFDVTSVTYVQMGEPAGSETAHITLQANPARIDADGYSTTTIRATLKDNYGRPVSIGTVATFTITPAALGTFPSGNNTFVAITTDHTGVIEVLLNSGQLQGRAEIKCISNGIEAVTYVQMGEPTGRETTYITLEANPTSIEANGYSTTKITATLRDFYGRPVPVGTAATFTTTMGLLPDGTQSYPAVTSDETGKIEVSLTSVLNAVGIARVECTSFNITGNITGVAFVGMTAPAP